MAIKRTGATEGMARSQQTKSMSRERQDAARRFVQGVVDGRFGGNVSQAAKAIGISQSMLYEFLNGTRGLGMKLLEGVADLEQCPMDVVVGREIAGPRDPRSATGWTLGFVQEEADPVPGRGEAVRFARANALPEEAIARVQSLAPRPWSPEQWYDRIKVEAAELPPAGGAPPSSNRLAVKSRKR